MSEAAAYAARQLAPGKRAVAVAEVPISDALLLPVRRAQDGALALHGAAEVEAHERRKRQDREVRILAEQRADRELDGIGAGDERVSVLVRFDELDALDQRQPAMVAALQYGEVARLVRFALDP